MEFYGGFGYPSILHVTYACLCSDFGPKKPGWICPKNDNISCFLLRPAEKNETQRVYNGIYYTCSTPWYYIYGEWTHKHDRCDFAKGFFPVSKYLASFWGTSIRQI